MRSVTRTLSTAVALLLALALASPVTIGHSAAATPATPNPVPLVNNPLVPDSAVPGGSDFTLTVNGTGFVSSSVVQWDGTALATTFVSASQLTAIVPATNTGKPGAASVLVTNPSPGGGPSNVTTFSIRTPFSAASYGRTSLEVGRDPTFVTAYDLNGDGKLDLLAALAELDNSAAISVSLGNGNATFQPVVLYPLSADPSKIVIGDFNHDGKADLAVSSWGGLISILLGNGDGTLQPPVDIPLTYPNPCVSATTGDFDNDGNLDLATVCGNSGLLVLLGNGDGTFQPPVSYGRSDWDLATGDFNGDGLLDLAVTQSDGVSILLGNGDGTFQDSVEYPTKYVPLSIVLADLNRDGRLDLAVRTYSKWISVLLGHGDGTFGTQIDYKTDNGEFGIEAEDLNGDNILDLAITSYYPRGVITTFLGNGDGTFGRRSDFAAGFYLSGIAVGDFNGDGRLDLVTANSPSNFLYILPQVTSDLSSTHVEFGHVKLGERSIRKVTFTNTGVTPFTIASIGLAGRSKDGFTEYDNCGSQLAPGMSCKIKLTFKPRAAIPYRHANVKISDSATNVTQKIYLVGRGTY